MISCNEVCVGVCGCVCFMLISECERRQNVDFTFPSAIFSMIVNCIKGGISSVNSSGAKLDICIHIKEKKKYPKHKNYIQYAVDDTSTLTFSKLMMAF